jgi:HlyD family secretion protein
MAAAIVVVVAGLAFAFWPRPQSVDLGRVERGSLRVTVDGEGQTRVRNVYVVSAPLAGRTARILLRPGDTVKAATTVVTSLEETDPAFLDVRTRARLEAQLRGAEAAYRLAETELERARAELEFARAELERAETLFQREATHQRALDQARLDARTGAARVGTAEAALQMRQFEVETARAALIEPTEEQPAHSDLRCCVPIRSPVDGKVLRVIRESATVVQPGDPLIEVGNPNDLEIVVDLPSAEAVRVQPGAAVAVEAWGGDVALSGRVRRIEPNAFTKVSALGIEEQRVNVVVDFVDAAAAMERLGHGYRVLARAVVYFADDVLLVPAGALFRQGADWAVFVAEEGRAALRVVEIGPNDGRIAEVRRGLGLGDTVVLYPADRIADGVRIAPRSQ